MTPAISARVLNEMFEGSDPEAESVDTFSGSIVKDGDTYRLNLTVNSSDVFEDQESEADELGMDPSDLFSFVYLVTMPGEVTETNGTKVGDNQVRWDLPITGSSTLTAVSEGSGSGRLRIDHPHRHHRRARARRPGGALHAPAPPPARAPRRRASARHGMPPMAPDAGMPASEPVVTGTGETLPPVEPEPTPGPDDDTRQLPRP
jgi:hypothetical protein